MRRLPILTLSILLAASGTAGAQNQGMQDMPNMGGASKGIQDANASHQATGTVKRIDPAKGTVTFAHGPVKSLGWPAMTMGFVVKDKKLLDKLAVDKKADFEFRQEGADYVVTSVK